jgi:hypothetical protein
MKHHHLQTSFITGAIDADGRARSDTALYKNGAAELLNCIPRASGGMLTRPGLAHRGYIGADQPVVIREFSFSLEQSYILVFTAGQMVAHYASDGAEAGYVTGCPWSAAQLPGLRFAQSGDTMIITHPDFAPQRLLRTGAASWTVGPLSYDGVRGTPMFRYAAATITAQATAAAAGTLTLAAEPVFAFDPGPGDITNPAWFPMGEGG